jgi:hypothetical protein
MLSIQHIIHKNSRGSQPIPMIKTVGFLRRIYLVWWRSPVETCSILYLHVDLWNPPGPIQKIKYELELLEHEARSRRLRRTVLQKAKNASSDGHFSSPRSQNDHTKASESLHICIKSGLVLRHVHYYTITV